jgi:hypothetical protein
MPQSRAKSTSQTAKPLLRTSAYSISPTADFSALQISIAAYHFKRFMAAVSSRRHSPIGQADLLSYQVGSGESCSVDAKRVSAGYSGEAKHAGRDQRDERGPTRSRCLI